MTGPSGERALTIAPLDDSDGNLSLAVAWSSNWITRSPESLPPYWLRLPAPPLAQPSSNSPKAAVSSNEKVDVGGDVEADVEADAKLKHEPLPKESYVTIDSIQKEGAANATRAISCHVTASGLAEAIPEQTDPLSSSPPDYLYIDHLRPQPNRMDGTWFTSALTAYGVTHQTMLWNYSVPSAVLTFARGSSMPCGVLELLGFVDAQTTPAWMTADTSRQRHLDRMARRARDRNQAAQREMNMPAAERMKAQTERMAHERQEDFDNCKFSLSRYLHLKCTFLTVEPILSPLPPQKKS